MLCSEHFRREDFALSANLGDEKNLDVAKRRLRSLFFRAFTPKHLFRADTDGTMESNTKSAFAENHLFETSDNIVQKG